jgi:hypothetical protein
MKRSISANRDGSGGCGASGMKEVPSRELEKQIGQWSSSSASFHGRWVEASSFADVCQADLCQADLCQVLAASELE